MYDSNNKEKKQDVWPQRTNEVSQKRSFEQQTRYRHTPSPPNIVTITIDESHPSTTHHNTQLQVVHTTEESRP